MRLFRIFGAAAVAVALGVAGLGGAAAARTAAASNGPARGGTLTYLASNDNRPNLDPVRLGGVPLAEGPIPLALYDTLFYQDPKTAEITPRLGLSLTTPDSGKTWTLKLRPNVKFSDGTPFDAEAVRFNWARIADPANAALAAESATAIDTMQVVDPLTLRFTLKTANPKFDIRVAYNLGSIGSPTAIKALGSSFATKPVGAGPFLLKEAVANAQYTMVRNPDYWQKGRPYLDGLVLKFVADDQQRYDTVKTGGANMMELFAPSSAAQAQQDGLQVVTMSPTGGGWAIGLNNSKPPFDDVRVRQAIDLAVDRQEFNKTLRSVDKSLTMTAIEEPGTPFYNKDVKVPKTNLTEAQKLIDQVVAQTGKPVQFTLEVYSTPYIMQDAQLIQAQLSRLKNVKVDQEILAAPEMQRRYVSGSYQALTFGLRWTEQTIGLYNNFLSTSALNYWRYKNTTVDNSLTQLLSAASEKDRVRLVRDAEAQLVKDSTAIYYTRYSSFLILDKTVNAPTIFYDQRVLWGDVSLGKARK
jgi:peptide/nickel transport system substrate-binding protein